MSSYIYLARIKVLVGLEYRFEVFTTILTSAILLFATSFFWKTAYSGVGAVSGVNQSQMITYSIISVLLGSIFITNSEYVISSRVREGDIVVDLIKPVNMIGIYLAQDLGDVVSAMLQKSIPLLLFAILFIKAPIPSSPINLILFLFSCLISYSILWLLSSIIGFSSFWLIELGPLGYIKDAIVRILSGSIVPIWFFPDAFQRALKFLPFIYTYQLPIGIYIGKFDITEAIQSIIIQLFWSFILFLLLLFIQKKSQKHILVQGG